MTIISEHIKMKDEIIELKQSITDLKAMLIEFNKLKQFVKNELGYTESDTIGSKEST